jgi:hypothetical protein
MSIKEVLYFVLLQVFFIIIFLSTNYFYEGSNTITRKTIMLTIVSIAFSLFFIMYLKLTGLCVQPSLDGYQHTDHDTSYHPSPGAKLCRGGPYFWQGNSKRAKFCRELASTQEGQEEIERHSCGAGYVGGGEGNGFKFTPLSNSNWRNSRCDSTEEPKLEDNGIF